MRVGVHAIIPSRSASKGYIKPSEDTQNRAYACVLSRVGQQVDQVVLGPFPCPLSLNFSRLS